jgi:hypothetical protein
LEECVNWYPNTPGLISAINPNCFASIISKGKWKQGDNKFHYKNKNPEIHYYSNDLVEEFIKKIME